MIQRIQTIFLLITALLMGIASFFPLIEIVGKNDIVQVLYSWGIGTEFEKTSYPTWGILTFSIIGFFMPVINIFLYKKRKLQIKIGWLTVATIVIYYITTAVYFLYYMKTIVSGSMIPSCQFALVLPFIALIFNILAILRIKKDEKLVKSLNRIR